MKLTVRSPATDGFHRVEVHQVYDPTQARILSQAAAEQDGAESFLQDEYQVLNMANFMAKHRLRMAKARRVLGRWKARQEAAKVISKGNVVRLGARNARNARQGQRPKARD